MADASESSFPFSDSALATEEQWARYNRSLGHAEGVVNLSQTFGATNLQVTAGAAGTVSVDVGEAAINGFYYRREDAGVRSIPTNASGAAARNDLVVLEANQTTNEVTVKYLTGGSATPTLTRNIFGVWQMPLAAVQVPAGAVSVEAANITDYRSFVMPQGIVMANGSQLPAGKLGQWLLQPGKLSIYMSTGWQKIWPTTFGTFTRVKGSVGLAAGLRDINEGSGTGYANASYAKFPDGLVLLKGTIENGGSAQSANAVIFTLPTEFRPSSTRIFSCAGSGGARRIDVYADGKVRAFDALATGDFLSLDGISFAREV